MKNNPNYIWSILGVLIFFSIGFIHSYYPASTPTFWIIWVVLIIVYILLGNILTRKK